MNWTWTIKSCSKNTWLNSMTMAILTNVRRSWRQEVKWWLWCVCVNIMFMEVHQTCTESWVRRKLSWGITAILAIYNSGRGGDTLELRSFRKLMKDNQYQLNLCSPPLLIGRICECTHTHTWYNYQLEETDGYGGHFEPLWFSDYRSMVHHHYIISHLCWPSHVILPSSHQNNGSYTIMAFNCPQCS